MELTSRPLVTHRSTEEGYHDIAQRLQEHGTKEREDSRDSIAHTARSIYRPVVDYNYELCPRYCHIPLAVSHPMDWTANPTQPKRLH